MAVRIASFTKGRLGVALGLAGLLALGSIGADAQPAPEKDRGVALQDASRDAKVVRQGKKLYGQLCASCHGAEGTTASLGEAPTNLFDAKWIYGGKPEEIWATINKGALEKGMPAWQGVIAEDDLVAVTAYLLAKKAP